MFLKVHAAFPEMLRENRKADRYWKADLLAFAASL
jgi:hypothetical protein